MANIEELKITSADTNGKKVADLPTNPSESLMDAATLQKRFDALPELAIEAINALIDYLVVNGAGDKITPEVIGAAPVGTNLDGVDFNTILSSGFYVWNKSAPNNPFSAGVMLVINRSKTGCVQIAADNKLNKFVHRSAYSGTWSEWDDFGDFKSDGSVSMDGPLWVNMWKDYGSVGVTRMFDNSSGDGLISCDVKMGIDKLNTAIVGELTVEDAVNGATSALRFGDNYLALYNPNTGKEYEILGKHIKPDGYYTGNGSATERFIDVGGNDGEHKALLIGSTNGFALVFGIYGSVVKNVETLRALKSTEAQTTSAQSLKLKTTDICLNQNGVEYYYKNI